MDGLSGSGRESLTVNTADSRTAGQADAMMEPMQKSLNDCLVCGSTPIRF